MTVALVVATSCSSRWKADSFTMNFSAPAVFSNTSTNRLVMTSRSPA